MLRILTILLLLCSVAAAQPMRPYPLPAGVKGKAFIIESRFAPFPDSLRNAQPRVYNGKTYSAAEHYSDSSVLVFIPDYFDAQKSYRFVCWFHGWNNNIDSSLKTFQLLEQFYAARRNAIFIFPEGPKNAPDSYGGKWEHQRIFEGLWGDLHAYLRYFTGTALSIKDHGIHGKVDFAGHSGAYRIIAKHLQKDNELQYGASIYLFDGLYGELDWYYNYAMLGGGRFVHIYTDDGGTKENSLQFINRLKKEGNDFLLLHKEEEEVTEEDLKKKRIIFLHSKKGHNEVITSYQNFERLLRAFYQ